MHVAVYALVYMWRCLYVAVVGWTQASIYMDIYIYICMCMYLYIYVCIHVSMPVHVLVNLHVKIFAWRYLHTFVQIQNPVFVTNKQARKNILYACQHRHIHTSQRLPKTEWIPKQAYARELMHSWHNVSPHINQRINIPSVCIYKDM